MDTFSTFLLLGWLIPCTVGAVGVRIRPAPWSVSLLVACSVAEVIACCGGSVVLQMGVAIFGTLVLFVGLDLNQLFHRREAELTAQQAGISLHEYLEQNPRLYVKTGVRRKVHPKLENLAASQRRFVFWKRKAKKRAFSSEEHQFATGEEDGPVEVIVAAERIVLEREASAKGYWQGRGLNGDVQVFVPPGADAYPGRVVSAVRKPNGKLMAI